MTLKTFFRETTIMRDYNFKIKNLTFLNNFKSFDSRGVFEKILPIKNHKFNTKEVFFSTSIHGSIRGMHIQKNPYPTAKIIKIIKGKVLDVILDCRKQSSTFGKFDTVELDQSSDTLFIPKGCAHGFQTLSENATMLYITDNIYHPESDTGYKYDSFGFKWPIKNITISERDKKLPNFKLR